MNDIIDQIKRFIQDSFDKCTYYDDKIADKNYRIEHMYRVAGIGREIARQEGLDEEKMTIGCLLHDIGYSLTYPPEEHINHGRYGAKIARSFLLELGMEPNDVEEICYGIAIHVDDKADFDGPRTILAETIGEADNIDRFGAYRIYETLRWKEFEEMSLEEKRNHVEHVLQKLHGFLSITHVTKTSTQMWHDVILYQIEFYNRLKKQIENSKF